VRTSLLLQRQRSEIFDPVPKREKTHTSTLDLIKKLEKNLKKVIFSDL